MIEIKYKDLDISDFLDDVRGEALKEATVKATNRALSAAYREGGRIMEKERQMEKKGSSSLSYFDRAKQKKVRSSHYAADWACLKTSDDPLSLQNYVEGSKEPENQKGIPVRRRRKLRIKVKQASIEKSKAFIARVKGNNHVFRLAPGQLIEEARAKQATTGVHKILSREENQERMAEKGIAAFERNFDKIFEREYQKVVDKHSD